MWAKLEAARVTLSYGSALNLIFAQLNIPTPSELFIKRTHYDLFNSTTLKQMSYDKGDQGWYFKGGRPQRVPAAAPPPPLAHDQGGDPMDTSSAPRSDNEDSKEGSEDDDEEEEINEEEEGAKEEEEDEEEEENDDADC
ncbi:uncharacterized protein LOC131162590 [Malania oleifera]|uniref:uncharacterized protein LOC131162590 n=1 Tax=Malania oleifera TaxID=397392 RepID=UPI0025ADDFF9|nr:uncharacterized protein LOC131162590 [Malania oleifera]